MTSNSPSFSQLVGDESIFFNKHFNRQPLLRRSALSADPHKLLSISDLDDMMFSGALRQPDTQVSMNGEQVSRSSYMDPVTIHGEYIGERIVPERVVRYFEAGASVVWKALNYYSPEVHELVAEVSGRLMGRGEAIGILTPPAQRGFAPHFDPVDVFVLQLEGSKGWKVWSLPTTRPNDASTDKAATLVQEDALGAPLINTSLNPGDVLYIPYHCAHVAETYDESSLHVSITVQVQRWADILASIVRRIVLSEPTFSESPYAGGDTIQKGARFAEDLSAKMDALVEKIVSFEFAPEAIRPRNNLPSPGGRRLQTVRDADAIAPDTVITSGRELPQMEVIDSINGSTRIRVAGVTYTLPAESIAALAIFLKREFVLAGSYLTAHPQEYSVSAVRALARIGLLAVVNAPRSQR